MRTGEALPRESEIPIAPAKPSIPWTIKSPASIPWYPISFKEIVNYKADISLIAYENSTNTLCDLNHVLNQVSGKSVNVIIGAEGGLTKEEVELALNDGYQEITLGKRILRSETACFYILSLLSFFMDK